MLKKGNGGHQLLSAVVIWSSMHFHGIHVTKKNSSQVKLVCFWKNYQLVAGGSIWDILDLNIIKVFVANDIHLSLLQLIQINEKKK